MSFFNEMGPLQNFLNQQIYTQHFLCHFKSVLRLRLHKVSIYLKILNPQISDTLITWASVQMRPLFSQIPGV